VPALVRELTCRLPRGPAAAVHQGATSQDVIDTAAMLLARQALGAVAADLAAAAAAAAGLAEAYRDTIMIGRTLLQQAVPVTFGLVAAGWLTGLDEARAALARVTRTRLAVQFGGAAGTLAPLGGRGREVAELLAIELGLAVPVLPWSTDRLRITEIAGACAGAAGVLGKIARDVTLLAQSEIGEVREGGGGGGSSAMPHKNNPAAAIAILGCTRQVPGLLATLAAAAEQEHQRAAGAWHAEWEPLSDLLRLTGSAASWGADLLASLEPDPARMRDNLLAAGGFPMAERVASLLSPELGRTAAHEVVAQASTRAVAGDRALREVLLEAPEVAEAGITAGELDEALDPTEYLGSSASFVAAALAAYRAGA
jgi:3-carboxy-cis,cis-muconate cycloisomerase